MSCQAVGPAMSLVCCSAWLENTSESKCACRKDDPGSVCRTRRDTPDEARLSCAPGLPRQRVWRKVQSW